MTFAVTEYAERTVKKMSDINRQEAIDTVKECIEHKVYWEVICDIEDAIKALPSAERPTGKWIGEADGYADGEFVYDTWYCSICDFMVETDGDKPTWNYCPNCGAKMEEQ